MVFTKGTPVRFTPDFPGYHEKYPLESEGGTVYDIFTHDDEIWFRVLLDDSSFTIPVQAIYVEAK